MKTTLIAMVVITLASVMPTTGADKEKAKQSEPAFPGQPYLNQAINRLKTAKESLQGGKQTADTVAILRKVEETLKKSVTKGNYIVDMRRLAGQAASHLEKGDTAKALAEVEDALKAAYKAGEVDAR